MTTLPPSHHRRGNVAQVSGVRVLAGRSMVDYRRFVALLVRLTSSWAAAIHGAGSPALAGCIVSVHLAHEPPQAEAEDARHGEKDDAGEGEHKKRCGEPAH